MEEDLWSLYNIGNIPFLMLAHWNSEAQEDRRPGTKGSF